MCYNMEYVNRIIGIFLEYPSFRFMPGLSTFKLAREQIRVVTGGEAVAYFVAQL